MGIAIRCSILFEVHRYWYRYKRLEDLRDNMKVIVASLPKTGTKTVSESLRILGYGVDDFLDQYQRHHKQWWKIMNDGQTTQDFKEMYKDVDAVVDMPACCWWEEIHRAFPEAKIILTMRENEDVWLKSLINQYKIFDGWIAYFRWRFSIPTRRQYAFFSLANLKAFGHCFDQLLRLPYPTTAQNDMMCKYAYRRHNAHVMQSAPKDKLLVWDLSDGWKPLCEFLGKPVPNVPFPHSNKGGSEVKKLLAEHPLQTWNQRVRFVEISLFSAASFFLIYHFATNTREESFLCRGFLAVTDAVLSKIGYSR